MNFDLISFLAGIAAGFLISVLVRFSVRLVPRLRSAVSTQIRNYRELNIAAVENAVKTEAYQRAQTAHVSSSLFPLNEIIILPLMIPAPKNKLNNHSTFPHSPTDQIIPFTPGYTELASVFPVTKITLEAALRNKTNCFVTGPPGSGKTVALADLVSRICLNSQDNPSYSGNLLAYLHVFDLSLTPDSSDDSLDVLQNALNEKCKNINSKRFQKLFQSLKSNPGHKIILVLDGMDELLAESALPYFQFLERLMGQVQNIQIVTTANPEYTGRLLDLGFAPLGISSWNSKEVENFTANWTERWIVQVNPKENSRYLNKSQYRLIMNWLQREKLFLTPLEWTMVIWSACAGDSAVSTPLHAMDAYITRLTQKSVPRSALENLAGSMIENGQLSLSIPAAGKIFSQYRPKQSASESMDFLQEDHASESLQKKKKGKEKRIVSKGAVIDSLLQSGMLTLFNDEKLAFKCPILPGFLASFTEAPHHIFTDEPIIWCGQQSILRYYAAQNKHIDALLQFLDTDKTPLFHNLLLVGRWLHTGKKYPWRDKVFERLGYLLAAADIPKFQMAKITSALLTSNDPSIHLLFTQLLKSPKAHTRLIASLGVAALGIDSCTNKLISLLEDRDPDVRLSASLALTQLSNPLAGQVVEEIIKNAGEEQRIITAEAAAVSGESGFDRICAYLQSEDMLTRRAALGALIKFNPDRVIPLAEQIFNEDSQWILRNMAAEILETCKNPLHPFAPEPLSDASDTPWLIEYASEIGQGISPGIIPYDVLVHAVQNGNTEQQSAAMEYLSQVRDPKLRSLYEAMIKDSDTAASEQAAYHLWLHSTKDSNRFETVKTAN